MKRVHRRDEFVNRRDVVTDGDAPRVVGEAKPRSARVDERAGVRSIGETEVEGASEDVGDAGTRDEGGGHDGWVHANGPRSVRMSTAFTRACAPRDVRATAATSRGGGDEWRRDVPGGRFERVVRSGG